MTTWAEGVLFPEFPFRGLPVVTEAFVHIPGHPLPPGPGLALVQHRGPLIPVVGATVHVSEKTARQILDIDALRRHLHVERRPIAPVPLTKLPISSLGIRIGVTPVLVEMEIIVAEPGAPLRSPYELDHGPDADLLPVEIEDHRPVVRSQRPQLVGDVVGKLRREQSLTSNHHASHRLLLPEQHTARRGVHAIVISKVHPVAVLVPALPDLPVVVAAVDAELRPRSRAAVRPSS